MARERVFIGLGSNIGNRRRNIQRAWGLLEDSGVIVEKKSSFYKTSAVGHIQRDYFNAVIQCRTGLPPQSLLRLLRTIERKLGRTRTKKWGPRTIDLDIIFFGKRCICTRNLIIPHPHFAERKFVLWPLREIAPRLRPPGYSLMVQFLAKHLTDSYQKIKIQRYA
jgi:2-amino-4-hydroxy-6-hydroxymethyldihydropteridine diphosphokinase